MASLYRETQLIARDVDKADLPAPPAVLYLVRIGLFNAFLSTLASHSSYCSISSPLRTAYLRAPTSGCSNLKTRLPPNSKQGYRRKAKPATQMNAPSQHSSPLRAVSTSGCSNLKTRLPPNSKQGYRREANNHSTKPAFRMHNTVRRFALLTFALQRAAAPTSRLGFP